jgi:hypothetical protein
MVYITKTASLQEEPKKTLIISSLLANNGVQKPKNTV